MLKHPRFMLLLVWLCLLSGAGRAQTTPADRLLLVTGDATNIETLSHADIRRLYLGNQLMMNGVRIRPVLNVSDPLMTEVFLQNIIFMSRTEYERQLLSRVFRLGGQRPPAYENMDDLVKQLLDTPGSVTFMWATQLKQHAGLKSLGVLWASSND